MTEDNKTEIEFELQDVLDLLPPDPADGERRVHNLTRHDLLLIAKLIKLESKNNKCQIDLTQEQEVLLKRLLNALSSGVSLVSILIVTAVVGGVIAIFTKGFWAIIKTKVGG